LTQLQGVGLVLFALVVAGALRSLDLRALVKAKHQQHLVFGSAAALFGLWLFRAGIFDGLDVHILGLTIITLMLGFRYALITATITLVGATFAGYTTWDMFGINGLLAITLPIVVTYLVYMVSFHHMPRHLFVYLFVCAFFTGAIAIALKTLALGGYYYIEGTYSWNIIVDNYLLLIPLMVFPEAFLSGMIVTVLVIYQPTWMYTFHDKFYLDGQ
jgi:uncharacterized membrane protein